MISFRGILTVIKNSRWYSADMTVFSCLACFLYALGDQGCVINGVIAFVGILFAHMATNLYDDYSEPPAGNCYDNSDGRSACHRYDIKRTEFKIGNHSYESLRNRT